MLNEDYCGVCERQIKATDVFYVHRAGWEKYLKRKGWRWTHLGWTCPECLEVEERGTHKESLRVAP